MSERLQYYSATPDEIREDLGLDADATQSEVYQARLRQYDASVAELISEEGERHA